MEVAHFDHYGALETIMVAHFDHYGTLETIQVHLTFNPSTIILQNVWQPNSK